LVPLFKIYLPFRFFGILNIAMLYFSKLKGKKVITQDNKAVGKVYDMLFSGSETPLITKLKIITKKGDKIFIPIDAVQNLNHKITVIKEYREDQPAENELSLMKSLLDKQIIDIKGSKVVRVNDIAIQDKLGKSWYVTGVDVGIRGILRWLKLEDFFLPLYKFTHLQSHPHFLSWADFEPLELLKGKVQLKKDVDTLERMRPEDLADYLEQTNIRNVNKFMGRLNEEYAADVISDLSTNFQSALFKRFIPEKASKLIELIDPEDAVDILLTLTKEKRVEILNALTEKKRKKLISLLKISGTPIGNLITTGYIYIEPNASVKDAFSILREKAKNAVFTNYLYVINSDELLVGIIDISDIFRQTQNTIISDIMEQDIINVHLTTPLNITIKRMLKYKLSALPVIEDNKKMIGIITFNDVAQNVLEGL
jgi:magnesium transporter